MIDRDSFFKFDKNKAKIDFTLFFFFLIPTKNVKNIKLFKLITN